MEYGFIKKLILISICAFLLCACGKNKETVVVSKDIKNYAYSQELDKCGITELCEYSLSDKLSDIVAKSKYVIDEEQVSNYSIGIVDNYQYIAYMYGKSLEEYYTENMGLTKNEFYEKCYKEGIYDVKYIYTIGAIAHDKNISVSKEEYEKYLKEKEYSSNIDDVAKDRVVFLLVESKIKKLFKEGELNEEY